MESTLPDGGSILFNRDRWVQRRRKIYAVRPYLGPVVKRAARRGGPVTSPATSGSGAGSAAAGYGDGRQRQTGSAA